MNSLIDRSFLHTHFLVVDVISWGMALKNLCVFAHPLQFPFYKSQFKSRSYHIIIVINYELQVELPHDFSKPAFKCTMDLVKNQSNLQLVQFGGMIDDKLNPIAETVIMDIG